MNVVCRIVSNHQLTRVWSLHSTTGLVVVPSASATIPTVEQVALNPIWIEFVQRIVHLLLRHHVPLVVEVVAGLLHVLVLSAAAVRGNVLLVCSCRLLCLQLLSNDFVVRRLKDIALLGGGVRNISAILHLHP